MFYEEDDKKLPGKVSWLMFLFIHLFIILPIFFLFLFYTIIYHFCIKVLTLIKKPTINYIKKIDDLVIPNDINKTRKYDLILYGITGYTGQKVLKHCINSNYFKSYKIAIAGRNIDKLNALKTKFDIEEIDTFQVNSLKDNI